MIYIIGTSMILKQVRFVMFWESGDAYFRTKLSVNTDRRTLITLWSWTVTTSTRLLSNLLHQGGYLCLVQWLAAACTALN